MAVYMGGQEDPLTGGIYFDNVTIFKNNFYVRARQITTVGLNGINATYEYNVQTFKSIALSQKIAVEEIVVDNRFEFFTFEQGVADNYSILFYDELPVFKLGFLIDVNLYLSTSAHDYYSNKRGFKLVPNADLFYNYTMEYCNFNQRMNNPVHYDSSTENSHLVIEQKAVAFEGTDITSLNDHIATKSGRTGLSYNFMSFISTFYIRGHVI